MISFDKIKKSTRPVAAAVTAAAMALCGSAFAGCTAKEAAEPEVSKAPVLLSGVELDLQNTIFDDFVGGINSDLWYIGKQAWGNNNGGVIPENVGYTDEGVLVFTGRGGHYAAQEVSGVGPVKDGSLTGGALISRFLTGPGRDEVKMKVLPRLGACTALWVYAYDASGENGPENHEIDIELPGGKTKGTQSFNSVLNTNYITEEFNISQDVDLTANRGSDSLYSVSDGEWHTFGFDWYTDPGKVVYYVDGIVTTVSDQFVPSLQTRLWLGVWFPNSAGFVGTADFEEDYLQVDWLRYTPFKDQPCKEFLPAVNSSQVAALSEYPSAPSAYEEADKISNGDFEHALAKEENGWSLTQIARPDAPAVETECRIEAGVGRDGSCGAMVKDRGVLGQNIDCVYDGFTYELSFDSKCLSAEGKGYLRISYRSEVGTLKSETVNLSGGEWKTNTVSLTAPDGCTKVRLEFYTEDGNTVFLDNIAMRRT